MFSGKFSDTTNLLQMCVSKENQKNFILFMRHIEGEINLGFHGGRGFGF